MDLAFLKFPKTFRCSDLWQLKLWTAYSVKQAQHIFAISQATKKDLITAYSVPEQNVSVTYPGVDRLKTAGQSLVTGKYLLYVGTLQPRKNLDNLIEAFKTFHPGMESSHIPGWKLVIAGKMGWKYQQKPVSHVKYLGYVPNEKLEALIKSAIGLVLPSLYEGFGIPVVQAMALGTPVLVSRNSSLPEIVGDCGLYIEPPFDAAAIRAGLVKLLSLTPDQKQDLLIKAQQRSKQFSWQTAAKTILNQLNLQGPTL
jgi:glycosyltransferase involved in cell wall biosynthesis